MCYCSSYLTIRPPTISTLFPYTTLFRSFNRDRTTNPYSRRLASTTTPIMAINNTMDVASNANRSEEHTSELQSLAYLVCRLLLVKKKKALFVGDHHDTRTVSNGYVKRTD